MQLVNAAATRPSANERRERENTSTNKIFVNWDGMPNRVAGSVITGKGLRPRSSHVTTIKARTTPDEIMVLIVTSLSDPVLDVRGRCAQRDYTWSGMRYMCVRGGSSVCYTKNCPSKVCRCKPTRSPKNLVPRQFLFFRRRQAPAHLVRLNSILSSRRSLLWYRRNSRHCHCWLSFLGPPA